MPVKDRNTIPMEPLGRMLVGLSERDTKILETLFEDVGQNRLSTNFVLHRVTIRLKAAEGAVQVSLQRAVVENLADVISGAPNLEELKSRECELISELFPGSDADLFRSFIESELRREKDLTRGLDKESPEEWNIFAENIEVRCEVFRKKHSDILTDMILNALGDMIQEIYERENSTEKTAEATTTNAEAAPQEAANAA